MIHLGRYQNVIRPIFAFAMSLVVPLITYRLLRANEGLLFLLLYSGITTGLVVAAHHVKKRIRFFLRIVLFVIHLGVAAAIIISLNLTPASAYLAWFQLVRESGPTGVLSFMFTLKITFFAAFLGGMVINRGFIGPAIALGMAFSLIFYAVYQEPTYAYVALGCGIAGTFYSAQRRKSKQTFAGIVRAIIPAFTLLLVVLLLAWPLSLIKPKHTNLLVDVVDSASLATAVTSIYPNFPFLYNMPGYGHQLGEKEIGTQPSLTARPVFEVKATPGETLYLRTAVYESFTGKGWVQRISSSVNPTAGYDLLYTGAKSRGPMANQVSIKLIVDFFSAIPHTLSTTAIRMNRGEIPELLYGSFDAGFAFDIPAVRGDTFLLERAGGETVAPKELSHLLQLPQQIPEDIILLAKNLGQSGTVAYTSANIRDFLAANYYYTLEPTSSSEYENPVWNFLLNNSEGYCVQFASSFVLLARMNNIPTRYVTGFLVHIPSDSTTSIVTGYSSHAWAEIWTPEYGWIVQEATPPMRPEFYAFTDYFNMYNPLNSDYTARQLELIMGNRVEKTVGVRADKKSVSLAPLIWIPLFPLTVLL